MTSTHTLADEYLHSLDRAARTMPRSAREELIAEIRDHLSAGLPSDASEADVRNLLDKLGPPQDIVAAAQPDRAPTRRGAREIFALVLLVTGFPPVIGWLVGVALLLSSPLWTWRQKLLGVLVWPGGYAIALVAAPLVASRAEMTMPIVGTATAFVILALAPLLVAGYLYRAAGRRESLI